MKIRRATLKDLKEISELFLEYGKYEHHLDSHVEAESPENIKKSERKHFATKTIYFLAEEQEKIVGCLNLNIDKRGKQKIAVFHTIIITKEARGRGHGNYLINYAFNYLKKNKCAKIRTFIHFANKSAQEFWKKNGFELEHGYVGHRELLK